jgi:hypothetical protein
MNTAEPIAAPGGPPGPQRARARHHPLLGGLLLKEGLNSTECSPSSEEWSRARCSVSFSWARSSSRSHELSVTLSKYDRTRLLGDVLVETQVISPIQLETALTVQQRTDGSLGEILIELGIINERQLKEALSTQLRIPLVDLDERGFDPSLASVITERYARHHRVLPIARVDDRIVLAMDDPTDVEVTAELRSCIGHRIDVVAATADALERAFRRVYGEHGDERPVRPSKDDQAEATRPESTELMPPAVSSVEQNATAADRTDTQRTGVQSVRAGTTLEAIRTRMDAIRHFVWKWERAVDTVEALLRERAEQRAALQRLAEELRDNRSLLARTIEQLEAKSHVLTRLEVAHAALVQEDATRARSLAELRERHEILLQDRQFATDRIKAALRRLKG